MSIRLNLLVSLIHMIGVKITSKKFLITINTNLLLSFVDGTV